jgi:hypothetical protein
VERKTEFLPVAIHTRVGKDGSAEDDEYGEDEEDEEGFFSPKISAGKSLPDIPSFDCRQWAVIAKTSSPTETRDGYAVKLYMIPNGWKSLAVEDDNYDTLGCDIEEEDGSNECGVPFYLTTEIDLPSGRRVLDMGFYGDDGRSNLSSGLDSGTGRERRQALGLLLGCGAESDSTEESIELWLLPYDNLTYQVIPAKKDSKQVFLDDGKVDHHCKVAAQPLTNLEDECPAEGVVYAKSKWRLLYVEF